MVESRFAHSIVKFCVRILAFFREMTRRPGETVSDWFKRNTTTRTTHK